MSTLQRKSWSDLARRRARSALTILTIAVAVAGLGIFAMPSLLGNAMHARVNRDRIYDAWAPTIDIHLSTSQVAALGTVPGIRALETRTVFGTRMWIGVRRADVLVVGVPDFAHQPVDAVTLLGGRLPNNGAEALVDPASRRSGRWDGGVGSTARLITSSGVERDLPVVGTAETLLFSDAAVDGSNIVLYVPEATAQRLSGRDGINTVEVRLADSSPAAARATMQQLRGRLDAIAHGIAFTDVPTIRPRDSWPGQQAVDRFETFLVIVAFVALISAVFLIANTMSSLVSEQRHEIGILKAIGARRRSVRRIYLQTAALFGTIGAATGAVLAVILANVLARYLGNRFFGVVPAWSVPFALVTAALALGIGVAVLATVPALRRASRVPVRAAFNEETTTTGASRTDRALLHLRLPAMISIGLRSITRRRGRTAATVLQVALAVAIMLSFLALCRTVVDVTNHNWDLFSTDIGVHIARSSKALSPRTAAAIAALPNVAKVEPIYFTSAELDHEEFQVWALPGDESLYRAKVHRGRWISASDDRDGAPVVVMGDALARVHHVRVGDTVALSTAAGPQRLVVIGIDDALNDNGRIAYLPLGTLRAILHDPEGANGYWIQARDRSNRAVDDLSTTIEDQLDAHGYAPDTQIFHVSRANNVAANRSLVTTIIVLGLLVVAISLIGLVNSITMNVLERTREIGTLRCIGARSADIRRAFRAEGLTVTFLGWAVGVPLGYLGARLLDHLVSAVFHFRFAFEFPLEFAWLALLGAVALSLAVTTAPLRRATRLRPGDALRYQ